MHYELAWKGQGCKNYGNSYKNFDSVGNGEDPEACAKLVKDEATCGEYFTYGISGGKAGRCFCQLSAAHGIYQVNIIANLLLLF